MIVKGKFKFGIFIVALFVLASAYVKAYTIIGPSMAPTYQYYDKIISHHLAYDFRFPFTDLVVAKTGDPERGDLIMYFDIPKNSMAAKRVMAIPGDIVSIQNNIVYVNGVAIQQTQEPRDAFNSIPVKNDIGESVFTEQIANMSYLVTYTNNGDHPSNTNPVKVSEGKYFILGDNRDNSADSRYIGLISRSQIKGKVIYGNRARESYIAS